jgi:hypothetical protein
MYQKRFAMSLASDRGRPAGWSYVATQGSDPGGSEGEGPRAIAGGPTESSACRFRGAHHLSCRRRREVVPFREGEAKKTRRRAFAPAELSSESFS